MAVAQPYSPVRLAEKQVARYREDVGEWQGGSGIAAEKRLSIEDVIFVANVSLEALRRSDAAVRKEFLHRCGRIDAFLEVRYALRQWLETSRVVLKHVEHLEQHRGQIEGAASLRDGTEMVDRRLNSARPIHIDELGQVFEANGEQAILPGITPEDVLESLEDERQGRLYPLCRAVSLR